MSSAPRASRRQPATRCGSPRRRRASTASPVRLAPAPALVGEYRTPFVRDPFGVSLDDKVDLLLRTDLGDVARARRSASESARSSSFARCAISRAAKERVLDQTIIESGGGLDATATSDDEVQTRSFPNSFGRHQVCAGWEAIEAFDLPGQRRADRRGGGRAAHRRRVSRRDHDGHPRRHPGRAPGARVRAGTRPSSTACSGTKPRTQERPFSPRTCSAPFATAAST